MNDIRFEQRIIVLSLETINYLFEQENGSDLVALYVFYHRQCKIQKTNQSWTTSGFVMKGLNWGTKRFRNAKNTLLSLGLIEDVQQRGLEGKIDGWYVKLNFIESHQEAILSTPPQKPLVVKATGGSQQTNAGSNKLEMLKVIKDKCLSDSENFSNEEVQEVVDESRHNLFSYKKKKDSEVISTEEDSSLGEDPIITEKVIPTWEEILIKHGDRKLMKKIHEMFESPIFHDKVDLNSLRKYYDHIIASFKTVYSIPEGHIQDYQEFILTEMDDMRIYYTVRSEHIKNYKSRLNTWIINTKKYSKNTRLLPQ